MFCNAEILGLRDNVLDMNSTDFDETLAVNILGSALAIKHSARAMVERKIRGSIISTASIEATLVCAAPIEIRVNCISHYGIATPMVMNAFGVEKDEVNRRLEMNQNLKGELLSTKNIVEATLFLASDESAYISGHNLAVDGVLTSKMMTALAKFKFMTSGERNYLEVNL
ncbi:hypothetical protein M9H77_07280 [Catharanthus roseus]|uniref:Uncharacterized protein n=1 Tax=Catharanthus roseus TaxID=4058 RepID=A0ACC0BUI1_CATRO|nr:hypothetical protein M9H77_07280 [Catharanthus roseus]